MEPLVHYQHLPGFRGSIIKEYSLVVNPSAPALQQVIQEVDHYHQQFGAGIPVQHPQLVIARFLAKEEMEDTLLRWMHRVISARRSFRVALNNYSGHPAAHSLFLRVQDHQPFKSLAKELKVIDELVRDSGLPRAELISKPHMTIAGQIEPSLYDQVMKNYSKKEFHLEFDLDELLLIKRTHQSADYQQVSCFRLQPG